MARSKKQQIRTLLGNSMCVNIYDFISISFRNQYCNIIFPKNDTQVYSLVQFHPSQSRLISYVIPREHVFIQPKKYDQNGTFTLRSIFKEFPNKLSFVPVHSANVFRGNQHVFKRDFAQQFHFIILFKYDYKFVRL